MAGLNAKCFCEMLSAKLDSQSTVRHYRGGGVLVDCVCASSVIIYHFTVVDFKVGTHLHQNGYVFFLHW